MRGAILVIALTEPAEKTDPGKRVALHTFLGAGSARALLVGAFVLLASGAPGVTEYYLARRQAGELANLFMVLTLFCLIIYVQAREMPLVYATRQGLDFEWAWGNKRHIAWRDVRQIKRATLLPSPIGWRFRLQLPHGCIEFYARSDLPRTVAQFQPRSQIAGQNRMDSRGNAGTLEE